MAELMPVEFTGVNMYDVREQCDPQLPLCYNFTLIDAYLNQPEVMEQLGTTGHRWAECNKVVDMELAYAGDWMLSFDTHVAEVLEAGVRVLIYAGEYDFICNWMGNNAWTQTLDWSGKDDFANAANQTWSRAEEEAAGSFRSADGLTFLKVFNAGHMVPRDQPENALDMVVKHINGEFVGA
jgi:cathepsin A (carboxypeptidase C)